jgi:D-3-phosphoglycerate dehydrogenase / 2-oxoglutarate reductase
MKVIINYQEYADVEIEKSIIREAFKDIEIIESRTKNTTEFIHQAKGTNAALIQYIEINKNVINALPQCRGYVRFGIAYNNIDVDYAARQGKIVANVPYYCIDEVSNHALSMILALNRKLIFSNRLFLENNYQLESIRPITRLKDCTVGIVGMGRIAQYLANKLQLLVKQILFYDLFVESCNGCEKVELKELFSNSDYVSLHLPLTEQTRNLINRRLLNSMKPNACIINTGRGGTLDEQALADLLQQKKLSGAALDVFETEPLPIGSPLRNLPNIILTNHNAWYSEEAIVELKQTAAKQVVQILKGEKPTFAVG